MQANRYQLIFRYGSYFFLVIIYFMFMREFAPLGIDWMDYHAQRVFNAVEFLRLNGYFSFWGFSVHTSCVECSPQYGNGIEIYKSGIAVISYLPYILINEIGGKESLLLIGPIWDFSIIAVTAILVADLVYESLRSVNCEFYKIWVSALSLIMFLAAPWTYKMMLALWNEVYFLLFFLLALRFASSGNTLTSIAFFIMACLYHQLWGIVVATVLITILLLAKIFDENEKVRDVFSSTFFRGRLPILYFLAAFISVLVLIFLQNQLKTIAEIQVSGSGPLSRMGISGVDPYNGGIIGAFQFMGGQRITSCVEPYIADISNTSLHQKMEAYNCLLTNISMWMVSLFLLAGLFFQIKHINSINLYVLPIAVAFLIMLAILQQSFSVHLLGYSYIFSLLISVGFLGCAAFIHKRVKLHSLSIVVITPIAVSILILFIHVSMLETVRAPV
jgi:hypothetical protein